MRDEQDEIRRSLNQVVGTEFDERGKRWGAGWFRQSLPRWIAGVLVGIAMATLIWEILDRHLKAAHEAVPKRPVVIDIIPGK